VVAGAVGRDVLAWRLKLYARKLNGELPELRWSELLAMTAPNSEFQLGGAVKGAKSLDAAIENPHTGAADVREGERLFAQHCAACHGADAGGGVAPSLRRATYNHGDSTFAIYRVIRDGVPQTAMVPAALDATQRWQVVAYLRSVQRGATFGFSTKSPVPVQVTSENLAAAGSSSDEWLTYSGNFKGWRYSTLAEITPDNVAKLREVWTHQAASTVPTQESTPLVVNGTMFVSESPSNAVAINSRTGELLWRYEHALPERLPVCCGPVNRGLALRGDLVYLATLDAQLVALDASTGAVRWQKSVASPKDGYTMTMAPLTFGDTLVVGVSGGEYGIRGFLAAYDATTGIERWRFNTIPGPGEPGHETWFNDAWRTGGGPTWVTGSYDPQLDLLYWGVGNPSPDFQGAVRPGDNLYTNSVVALRGATGELVWHFQFTPHDDHDWDSNQTPILTELEINGRMRRVICWANRNGFYYVLDAKTGEFLRGAPFVRQNWTAGLDEHGRPILAETGDHPAAGRRTYPGVGGGTNWYPPAYDPVRELVFVHANEQGSIFTQSRSNEIVRGPTGIYLASGAADSDEPMFSVRALSASTGEIRWEYKEAAPTSADGVSGMLATAGGVVFGALGGYIFALDSGSGRELWRQFLGGNTQAPPISFSLDGRQTVAVWGGRTLFLFTL
jgi:alcohol dehydrogenase (cytochrome c)